MTERFGKLMSLDGPLWCDGSPVIIEKGALLSDASKNQNLLQVKLRNVQKKPLKAVVLDIELSDVTGGSLGRIQHSYLDLDTPNGATFGEDKPAYLGEENARSFGFRIANVVFSDGTTWSSEAAMEVVAPADSLELLGELDKQFVEDMTVVGTAAQPLVLPTDRGGLWYCTCGALNDASNPECSTCGRSRKTQVAATDTNYLTKQRENAAEQKRASDDRKSAEQKKTARLVLVGAVIVGVIALVAVLVFTVAIPESKRQAAYQEASAALKSGEYSKAETGFTALGGYKNSAQMVKQAQAQQKYAAALKALEAKDYAAAIPLLEACVKAGGYKDAADRLAAAKAELAKLQTAADAAQKAQEAAVSAQKTAPISDAAWGEVKRGQTIEQAESFLSGTPTIDDFGGDIGQIHSYKDQGFYLSFGGKGTLNAVFFVNGGEEGAGFSKVPRKTTKGIGWNSTPSEVKRAYGSPRHTYSGPGWQRLEYANTSFRFQDGRLSTIAFGDF